MSYSFKLRLNNGAVQAGTLMPCTARISSTDGSVDIESLIPVTPSSGVQFCDLAQHLEGKTVPAAGFVEVPFSIRVPYVEAVETYDVQFDAQLSDGNKVSSNTVQVMALPGSAFLTSPTADGLLPVAGSLNFNSNTNSGLLGAI